MESTTKREAFFLSISGDAPLGMVLIGREAVRQQLSEEFFGPEGPLTPEHREEEAARWASFCDVENDWVYSHGEPFEWRDNGEDYAITITGITAPVPFEADLAWIRKKLKLPIEAQLFSGQETIAGRLHVVCANADSYRWMSEYRDREYHAWVAEKAELVAELESLRRRCAAPTPRSTAVRQ